MVDNWYERLRLNNIIGRHKSSGIALDALILGMLVDQLDHTQRPAGDRVYERDG